MEKNTTSNNRYFVTSIGGLNSCTKMEDALRGFARMEFEHALIPGERIGTMIARLDFFQDEYHKANPRIKKIEIRQWNVGDDRFVHVSFGTTTISLTKVRCEIL